MCIDANIVDKIVLDKHVCPLCCRDLLGEEWLAAHLSSPSCVAAARNDDDTKAALKCEGCGERFTSNSLLEVHSVSNQCEGRTKAQ